MSVWLRSRPVRVAVRSGRKLWQAAFGRDTAVEGFLRFHYNAMVRKLEHAPRHILFSSGRRQDHRIGIFLKGSCDLHAIFACEPLIRRVLNGTCCIMAEGTIADSRSDFLLQTLQDLPKEWLEPVLKKLRLSPDYFQTQLFKKETFVSGRNGREEFPKKAIFLSSGADRIRTLYRHREHGFLVDPGGIWLDQNLDKILTDLTVASWVRENFVSVGRISVDAFMENTTRIVQLLRQNTDAPIIMLNNFTVEPGSPIHNYQFIKRHHILRRKEFNIALMELSRKLDFSIVDVDRIVKRAGGGATMLDSAHYPIELYQPVAQEAFRIMRDLGLFS